MLKFEQGKLLKECSTFGIGGPAKEFVEVSQVEELQEVIRHCFEKNVPYFLLGKGSNSLFDDRGFNGLVIHNKICFCEIQDQEVYVGAGYSFSLLGVQTARKGLSGLEFASGIPASVGGAVYMNAGASGSETKDCLKEVLYINPRGEQELLSRSAMEFSYRHSSFQGKQGAIAAARFSLQHSDEARKKQLGIVDYRTKTQPYGEMSAGCIFRNPSGGAAGALIERCGLKGVRYGGAVVSEVHANFIVNQGGATAADVLALVSHVQKVVKERAGIDLEMEVRCIPYDTCVPR